MMLPGYRSYPIEIASLPNVEKTDHQYGKEDENVCKGHGCQLSSKLNNSFPVATCLVILDPSSSRLGVGQCWHYWLVNAKFSVPGQGDMGETGAAGHSVCVGWQQGGFDGCQLGCFTVDGCPWKEERNFHIEDDEEQGDYVETLVELDKARSDRRFAALVDFEFFLMWIGRADKPADQQIGEEEDQADAGKQGQVGNNGQGIRRHAVSRTGQVAGLTGKRPRAGRGQRNRKST